VKKQDADARRHFLKAGIAAAGTALWSGTFFQSIAAAAGQNLPPAEAGAIGRRELLEGLDGMSRVAEAHNTFVGGHTAAAVMASAFFCREQKLDDKTQKEILSLIETRLLKKSIYAPRPKEPADPVLIDSLVKDLDAGVDTLRQSGHNIIFTNICLKALREVPDAATPGRIDGLRKMVQSFGHGKSSEGPSLENKNTFVDLRDETKFIHFVFEEYLKAMGLYRNGRGYHGFAGHLLTAGHALVELHRMGYRDTAEKGVEAYWQFVKEARDGADLGGERVVSAPVHAPTPLVQDYWIGQEQHQSGDIVTSHLVKYPYSFFALAKELRDDSLRQRVLDSIYYLTAVS